MTTSGALCQFCEKPLPVPLRKGSIFCSKVCSAAKANAKYREENPYNQAHQSLLSLPSSTVGAIAELVVGIDLMSKGYDVFRAISPACSCDIVALSGNTSRRIEVRTGHRLANGKLLFSKTAKDQGRQDLFAVVVHGSPTEIVYLSPDGVTSFEVGIGARLASEGLGTILA